MMKHDDAFSYDKRYTMHQMKYIQSLSMIEKKRGNVVELQD